MNRYTKEKISKIGNTIIYFAERIQDLSKTKLLQLLYLLEESFIKDHRLPFLDIDFEVWQAGPVARDIFIELSDEPVLMGEYVEKITSAEATWIKARKPFSDDEFSDAEMEMLEKITRQYGCLTASQLVEIDHGEDSPWYLIAKEKGLLDDFLSHKRNSSEEKIDFSSLLTGKARQEYIEHLEFLNFSERFKS